jgi:hypothetical protein
MKASVRLPKSGTLHYKYSVFHSINLHGPIKFLKSTVSKTSATGVKFESRPSVVTVTSPPALRIEVGATETAESV